MKKCGTNEELSVKSGSLTELVTKTRMNEKVCRANEESSGVKSDRMGLTVKWPQPHFRPQTQGDEVGWET